MRAAADSTALRRKCRDALAHAGQDRGRRGLGGAGKYRVIVMKAGDIVEQGSGDDVLVEPKINYTCNLLAAIPHPPM